jgi:hypothetical protein
VHDLYRGSDVADGVDGDERLEPAGWTKMLLADAAPPPTTALSSTFNHGVDGWIGYGLEFFKPLS